MRNLLTAVLGRPLRDRRGAAAVEFALVLPAFLAMVFLLMEIGNYLWTLHTVDHAARETARQGLVRTPWGINWAGSAAAAETALETIAMGRLTGGGLKEDRATATATMDTANRLLTVTLTYEYQALIMPEDVLPQTEIASTVTMDLQMP
jgi:Flp pilus assembly protein TadG